MVKNSNNFYPIAILHRTFQTSHGDCHAGHWVEMKTKIIEVDMMHVTHAWIQQEMTCFRITYDSSETLEDDYLSQC